MSFPPASHPSFMALHKEKDMLSESVANIDASSARHAHASTLKLFGINH